MKLRDMLCKECLYLRTWIHGGEGRELLKLEMVPLENTAGAPSPRFRISMDDDSTEEWSEIWEGNEKALRIFADDIIKFLSHIDTELKHAKE